MCSGKCVDVATDQNNCGACGKTCEPGAVCDNGSCGCPDGEMTCEGACVDIKTDVNNCGGCGMTCGGTGSLCTGGACEQVVAAQQSTPVALALSSAGVFWINSGNGDVLTTGLTGGNVVTLAQNQSSATSICADADNVYWNVVTQPAEVAAIMTVPVGGGTPATFFSEPAGMPIRLAIDSTKLYWTDESGDIVAQPLNSATAATLATGQSRPYAIAVQNGDVYWSDLIGTSSTQKGQILQWTPAGGGTYTILASTPALDEVSDMAVDASNVYWVSSLGNIASVPTNGAGSPVTIVAGVSFPSGIAIDSTNIYWTTGSVGGSGGAQPDGTISTVPIAGGAPTVLVPNQISPSEVAVSSTSVYWITSVAAGAVMRLSPK